MLEMALLSSVPEMRSLFVGSDLDVTKILLALMCRVSQRCVCELARVRKRVDGASVFSCPVSQREQQVEKI